MAARHQQSIAILLSDAQLAADLAQLVSQDGLTAITAASCDELYGLLQRTRVDAVVIGARQNGFFTGLDLIERLAADLARPATLLVGALTTAEQQRAVALKVDRPIPVRGDVRAIADALRDALVVAKASSVFVPAGARTLVLRNDTITPLPQLLIKLVNSMNDPDATVADVARDIETDAPTTVELLKLANSAALGLRGRTTRVMDAVTLLGIKGTAALVLSAAVHRVQRELVGRRPDALQTGLRLRSLLTAGTAAAFARRAGYASPENAQILGLLQDIGMLVLLQAEGEQYGQLLRRVYSIGALRLDHCEQQEYGFTHADVSAALLQQWAFPNSVVSLVLDHHRELHGGPASEQHLMRAMQIGEAVADMKESPSPQRHHILSRLLEPLGGVSSDVFRTALAETVAWMNESCRLFVLPVPGEAELGQWLDRCLNDSLALASAATVDDEPTTITAAVADGTACSSPVVLVIDDDCIAVEILRSILGTIGVQVRHCSAVTDVQRLAAGVDAVLCDERLGGESGIDVVRGLRRRGLRIPIVGTGADRTRQTITRLLDAGVNDFILKPFSRSNVIDKLRRHLHLEATAVAPLKLYADDAVAAVG